MVMLLLPWILFILFITSVLVLGGIHGLKDPEFGSQFAFGLVMIILGLFFGLICVFLFVSIMVKCTELYERYSKFTEENAIELGLMEKVNEIIEEESNGVVEQQHTDMKF